MPFKDYSNTPTSNTELEGPIFIGPNMDRNNVRPALQQLAADGRDLYDEMVARGNGSTPPLFIQSGTGAVERSLQDKGRESVSVDDFGAVGDGITDDTAKVQAVLNSGASVVRFVGGKTYKLTAAITVPAGVFIDATGATINVAHNGVGLRFVNGGGIRGGKIIGPGGTTYTTALCAGIYCVGTSNSPLAPTYVTAPSIDDVEIANFNRFGIFFRYCRKNTITRAYVHNCAYAGIAGVSCEDISTINPRIYDIGPGSPGGDAYGWFFDRDEAGVSETSDPRSYRCSITDFDIQRVLGTGPTANGEGIDSHAGVDITIRGGQIIDCQKGIALVRSTIGGVEVLAPIRCKASGVAISGGHNSDGVVVAGAFTGGGVAAYATDCEIENVTVNGHGRDNSAGSAGIVIQGTKNLRVTGSTFKDNAYNAMFLNLSNLGLNITGNTFVDPHDTAYGAPACILIGGNDNRGFIGGNTFRYEDASLATNVAAASVRVNAGLTGLDLDFGSSTFQGIDATHLSLQLATTTGVNVSGLQSQVGTGTLAGGTVAVSFAKRFPAAPRMVHIQNTTDAAGIRPSAITATGFTATGTGTSTFTYEARL